MVDIASTRQDPNPTDQAKMGWERDKRLVKLTSLYSNHWLDWISPFCIAAVGWN